MNPKEILRHVEHRPFPLPARPWVMTQIWHRLLFAHWPLAQELLRPLVPAILSLDTFEKQSWISISPFFMTYVRPRFLPAVPGLSAFSEINVRTYVTYQGIPGVYFFSLDADRLLPVLLARALARLPYFPAHICCQSSAEVVHYQSQRKHWGGPSADFVASYRPVSEVVFAPANSLDAWLTERYCLYTLTRRGSVSRITIHHHPWPLQRAEGEFKINTMARAHQIALPDLPPLLHYANRLEVLIWPPEYLSPPAKTRHF